MPWNFIPENAAESEVAWLVHLSFPGSGHSRLQIPTLRGEKNLGNIGNSPGNPGKPLRFHGDRQKSGGSYGKTRFWHRNLGFSRVFSPLFRPQIHIPRRDFRLLRLQGEFVPFGLVLRGKSWNSSPREAGKAGIGGGKANPSAEIHGKSDSGKSSEQKAPPRVKCRRYPKKKTLEKAAPAEPGRNSRQREGSGRSRNSKSFPAASVEEVLSQKIDDFGDIPGKSRRIHRNPEAADPRGNFFPINLGNFWPSICLEMPQKCLVPNAGMFWDPGEDGKLGFAPPKFLRIPLKRPQNPRNFLGTTNSLG